MENLILIAVLVVLIGGASCYIYKAKKRGDACIGCPHTKNCKGHKCNCCTGDKTDEDVI